MLSHMNRSWKDWLGLIARMVLGIALIWAGLTKVGRLAANVEQVRLYELPLPDWATLVIGYVQPPLEILVGVLLVVGLFTRFSAILGAAAMAVFIVGISWAWAKGLSIDCGCFTPGGLLEEGEKTNYLEDILRDVFFLIAGIWLIVRPSSALSLDGWLFGSKTDYSHTDAIAD
ncbi:hypothetical protein HMPREF9306_01517 [Propionimicrobium lymphophilum ACS-093-V-SCH5]|uniref:Methylamine utilisation protein MauE domain-containing protein n=2 Tax=Propionimicrobium TaxID=203133 RepID=S2WW57_9ACTN|nr:hypothetical protein HMPREF9306_01517 [Propionimicrobium lymphophilum ACS-093-V-SCH5]